MHVLAVVALSGCEPEIEDLTDPVTVDGVSYGVVQIGEQVWFAENLQTTVYANGDSIPTGLTGLFANSEWATTTEGAVAVYGDGVYSLCDEYSPSIDACDEEQSLGEYGRLYNWYAVNTGNLCPTGWHVSTDEEYTTLTNGLGGTSVAGDAMKSSASDSPAWDGTNSSGFSGLAGGYRDYSGDFDNGGSSGEFWSASANGPWAWFRALDGGDTEVNRYDYDLRFGFSVRCVQD